MPRPCGLPRSINLTRLSGGLRISLALYMVIYTFTLCSTTSVKAKPFIVCDFIHVLSGRLSFTLASPYTEALTTICHYRVCPSLQTYALLSYDPRFDPTTAPGP